MKKSQRQKLLSLLKISFPAATNLILGGVTIEVGATAIHTMGGFKPAHQFTQNPILSINFTLIYTTKTMTDFIKIAAPALTDCKSDMLANSIIQKTYQEDILNQTYTIDCKVQIVTNSIDGFIERLEKELAPVIHDAFYESVEEVLAED